MVGSDVMHWTHKGRPRIFLMGEPWGVSGEEHVLIYIYIRIFVRIVPIFIFPLLVILLDGCCYQILSSFFIWALLFLLNTVRLSSSVYHTIL